MVDAEGTIEPTGGRRSRRLAQRRASRRQWWRRSLAAAALVWLGLVSWSLWGAYQSSKSAASGAQAVAADFTTLDAEALDAVGADIDDVLAGLRRPWVAPVRLIPWVGRQLNATEKIAEAGSEVVEAGAQALAAIETTTLDDPLAALDAVSTELGETSRRLSEVEVPSGKWLFGPVADARRELVENLVTVTDEIGRYEALVAGLSQMASGESTYLIAAANTSEMGNASGMLLQYGTMFVDNGAVLVSDFSAVRELGRPSLVPIDDDTRLLWSALDPGHLWQYTSLLSARASEVSRITADMWLSDQGERVDGVIIISPIAMEILLNAAGVESVVVDGEDKPTDELLDFLAFGQYVDYADDVYERRSAIAPVAAAAMGAIFDQDLEPKVLARALLDAIDGRHLFFWSRLDEHQERWQRAMAAGDPPADSVKVSVMNAGGNKLDRFVEVGVDVTDAADETAAQRIRLDIELTSTAHDDLPPYVAGARSTGSYLGHMVVNIPRFASDVAAGGVKELNASAPDGDSQAYVFIVELDPGQTVDYFIEFTVPAEVDSLRIEPSGRFPAIEWTVDGQVRGDVRSEFGLR